MDEIRLYPEYKELIKHALSWEYGSFHDHREIGDIMGIEPQTSRYYAQVKKARDELILHGRLLDTHIEKGYSIIEIDRYNEATAEDLKRAKRYLELSILKSQHAPVERMDEAQRTRHDRFLVKQVGLLNMTTPYYTEITKIVEPIPERFRIRETRPKNHVEETNHEED